MKQDLQQAVAAVVQEGIGGDVGGTPIFAVELTRPDEQFGDYSTNIALQIAGELGRPPREVAEELAGKLRESLAESVKDVSVAGPGFINLTLTDTALWSGAESAPAKSLDGKVILAEYSDPNVMKPLHAGHLYTTLVGDTISRLLENAGAKVTRLNYGGDVGLHVGRSMWAIIKTLGGEHPEKLADIPEAERPAWLGARYVEGTAAYEADESGEGARAAIIDTNRRAYKVHSDNDHDSPFAQIYWTCRQWSYDYFAHLYEQLQVKPFDRYIPESEVTQLGLDKVREQLELGVYKRSDGAVVYDGEAEGLHTRVFINSEGLPTYEAKDVGLILTKWRDYAFDQSIIITANEQSQYFQVMLASVSKFEPEPVNRTRHLSHGVVKLQGGVKMSSRKGNTVTALDILDAAHAAAAETPNAANEDTVLAAVKYAFAKNRIGGDIAYDPKESIALEGNSGPYLQYAHARARSIIAKAGEAGGVPGKESGDLQADERSLLRKLSEYAETIDRATDELMPHHICTYLYELAQAFNRFYEKNRVIGDEREHLRLHLVIRYAETLKAGLELLGIKAPDRM
jgi:arginyl-tRNA synthetase